MQISKSDYILFLKHPAWLWLKKHDKDKLPPIDDNLQAIFDNGHLFEVYAEKSFPEAVKIQADSDDYKGYKELTSKTQKAIESGAKTIFQGRLEAGDITCISDVLVKVNQKTLDLYEIKASTSVKPEHLNDLAFQVEVLKGSGYKAGKIFVIYVNNKYVRRGKVKTEELVKITEVTEKVKKLADFTQENIKKAIETAKLEKCPDMSPAQAKLGYLSEWLSIFKTLVDLDEYSIYHLCLPKAEMIGELESMGIKRIHEIPEDFALKDKQCWQVKATKNDEIIIDNERIKEFLSGLKFPLYFLDYETLMSLVPCFDGLGPYNQLPFQYSLHVLEKSGGQLKHFEYLHQDNSNPVKPLTEALKSQIGSRGTVLVWNERFEKGCNALMGAMAPEYQEFYLKVNQRVLDLMTPFSTGSYVHKDFLGSASIKTVLPVLIPDLSYKGLDIGEGNSAQRLWMEAVLDGKREGEKAKILADLLKYCELDTLAMVRIYQFLENIVGKKSEDGKLPF